METQSKHAWHSADSPFNLACINNTLHWNSTLHQLAVRAPANTHGLCNNLKPSSGPLKHSYGLCMRSHGLNKLSLPSQAIFLAQKIYIMAFLSTFSIIRNGQNQKKSWQGQDLASCDVNSINFFYFKGELLNRSKFLKSNWYLLAIF